MTDTLALRLPSPAAGSPDISLWLVKLDTAVETSAFQAILSEAEKSRATRFRFARDARRYRVSHLALRQVLSQQTGIAPADLAFREGHFGKPRLPHHMGLHFNMSHSGDWALIGTSLSAPLGVDLEVHTPMDDIEALAERNYTAAECAELRAAEDSLVTFLRCWTRKEACLKALGSGLSIEPGVFEAGTTAELRATTIDGCPITVASFEVPLKAQAAYAWIAPADRHREL